MSLISNNQQNSWVVPYSIEECGHRLMSLHEKFAFFAFGRTNRTTIKINAIDNFRYQFEMRRVRANSWLDTFGLFAIRGELNAQGQTATQVNYRIEPNWLLLVGLGIFLLFFFVFYALITDIVNLICFLPIVILVITINAGFTWWQMRYVKNQLVNVLGGNYSAY